MNRLLIALLLLASLGAAQNTAGGAAEIEQLRVKREGADVKIEVILTGAIQPSVETASNPDRLVLTLPGTVSDAKQKHFPLNANGVQGVRVGLNSANPPVTRVVVDMVSAHPYTVSTEGTHIIVRVQAAENETVARRSGPVPAASAPMISVFRRKPQSSPDDSNATAQAPIPVPPKLPPLNFPEKAAATSQPGTTTASAAAASASHPKLGSLQQGTVFPGMGTPGAGTVPQAQNQAVNLAPANAPKSAPLSITVTQGNSAAATPGAPTAAAAQNATAGTPAPTNSAPVAAASTIPASKPAAQNQTATSAATGSTTSSAGAPNVTTKVLSATVTPSAPVSGPAISTTSTATIPASQASAPSSSSAVPASGALGQAAVTTASSTPAPDATPLTGGNGQEAADATAVEKETEPEIPAGLALRAAHPDFRTAFRIKYVASGAAYLDGGRSAGLTEGMKLVVRETPTGSVVAAADGNDDNIV